jgi:diaminopimelate decarboxylase
MNTPYYHYDLGLLEETLISARSAAQKYNYSIYYAIKANNNPVITKLISNNGFGADCVSGNEVKEALRQGFKRENIVFAGVGKTDAEISFALAKGISCLNCESLEELEVISDIARKMRKKATVAIRVNPSVDAYTHRYITTGVSENKFGIQLSQLRQALDFVYESRWLDFSGLHFHIGSQITSFEPFINLCNRVNQIWKDYDIEKYGGKILNLGGGLGIDYENPDSNSIPPFGEFFNMISNNLDVPSDTDIRFELGRSLVGQCGSLVTTVLFTKNGNDKKFLITDAGMTELMRPALYQAKHRVENINSCEDPEVYDIVGPLCESSDYLAQNISLPSSKRGDKLLIRSCGAYAESMNLNYNMRARAESFFIGGKEHLAKAEATLNVGKKKSPYIAA